MWWHCWTDGRVIRSCDIWFLCSIFYDGRSCPENTAFPLHCCWEAWCTLHQHSSRLWTENRTCWISCFACVPYSRKCDFYSKRPANQIIYHYSGIDKQTGVMRWIFLKFSLVFQVNCNTKYKKACKIWPISSSNHHTLLHYSVGALVAFFFTLHRVQVEIEITKR